MQVPGCPQITVASTFIGHYPRSRSTGNPDTRANCETLALYCCGKLDGYTEHACWGNHSAEAPAGALLDYSRNGPEDEVIRGIAYWGGLCQLILPYSSGVEIRC